MDTHTSRWVGVFFLVMQFFVIIANYPFDNVNVFFWFCNHVPLLFAIAFFLKDVQVIKGIINVGFLGQLVWTIDFIVRLIFGINFLNITGYLFETDSIFQWILVVFIHVFSTFVAFYFTYDKKPYMKSLLVSILYLILLYFFTYGFTPEEENINWVYMIGFGLEITHPLYVLFWPFITFIVVVLPTHFIQLYAYKLSKRVSRF